jgi:Phage related hypothetical protein (DUF1799)
VIKASGASDDVEIWPENWGTFVLFSRIRTQWRVGFAGPTGLDYGVLFTLIDRMGLDADKSDQLFEDIRVMEQAALSAMQETT